MGAARLGLNPSKRIRCFSRHALEPTKGRYRARTIIRLPNGNRVVVATLEAKAKIPAICVAISWHAPRIGRRPRKLPGHSRDPELAFHFQPLKNLQEAYQSRTYACAHTSRKKIVWFRFCLYLQFLPLSLVVMSF